MAELGSVVEEEAPLIPPQGKSRRNGHSVFGLRPHRMPRNRELPQRLPALAIAMGLFLCAIVFALAWFNSVRSFPSPPLPIPSPVKEIPGPKHLTLPIDQFARLSCESIALSNATDHFLFSPADATILDAAVRLHAHAWPSNLSTPIPPINSSEINVARLLSEEECWRGLGFVHPNLTDAWLFLNYFRFLDYPPGTFLEIRAGNGSSNPSLFYETVLRWRGVCSEANPDAFTALTLSRPNCMNRFGMFVARVRSKSRSPVVSTQSPMLDLPSILRDAHITHISLLSLPAANATVVLSLALSHASLTIDTIVVPRTGGSADESVRALLKQHAYILVNWSVDLVFLNARLLMAKERRW